MSFSRSHIPYHRLTVDRVQASSAITVLKTIPILLLIFINFYLHYLRIHEFHRPLQKQKFQAQPLENVEFFQLENRFKFKVVHPFKKYLSKLEDTITFIKLPSKPQKPLSQILANLPVKPQELNQSEVDRLAEHESNLPLSYYHHWQSVPSSPLQYSPKLGYCHKVQLPDPLSLRQNNLYWQMLNAKNQQYHKVNIWLLNAYYDKRVTESPAVKIVASVDAYREKIKWWCLLWFSDHKSPFLVKSAEYFVLMSDAPGAYHTALITCPVPSSHHGDIPKAVSLQAYGHCDYVEQEPSNVLRVIYNQKLNSSKNSIGICIQSLKLKTYDVSVRLVEWLEMVRLFGAEKVYFYVYGVPDNIQKILEHYSAEGLVEWRPLTLPGSQPNVPSLYNLYAFKRGQLFWPQELFELNDCFYRNMYQHEYLIVKDIDEVVVPQSRANNWQEMFRNVESNMPSFQAHTTAFYVARHAHVCEVFTENQYPNHQPIPPYLYSMRHTSRSQLYSTSQNIKSFLKTSLVTAVHNHRPLRCIIPPERRGKAKKYSYCQGVPLDEETAVLMHYRRNQSASTHVYRNDDCKVRDRSVWRWAVPLKKAVREKLRQLWGG